MWPMLGFAGLIAIAVLMAYLVAWQLGLMRDRRQIIVTFAESNS